MPQNQNQKPTEKNEVSEPIQGTPKPLKAASVRTFRGDLSKSGVEGSRMAATLEPPKPASPDVQKSESTHAQAIPKNKAIVHTFKDDIQHLVRNQKTSLTRIAAMESNRRANDSPREDIEEEPKKAMVIVFLTILFVIIASLFVLGSYYAYRLNTTPPAAQQGTSSFIFIEGREYVDVTGVQARDVIELLASVRRNTFFSLGSMVELYLTEKITGENEQEVSERLDSKYFLETIRARIPITFLQTLGEDYILGIHVLDENIPFLLLTTRSYGNAFAGMLAWEKSIEEDLLPLFSPRSSFIKPASATGANIFEDTVMDNLDVRILYDEDGIARIMYAFIGQDAIAITTDARTLTELANRFRVR
ncbi:hypothetical protein CL644_01335 [bacterium]|nr:hypothetical protein [Parcubacteria group bacterium]MBF05330.1 hypothetical protein [bacterium]|tara:strand:- start:7079 stop:8164 length:1086 start_codon:yes stop_codon:yes gene_type:complete